MLQLIKVGRVVTVIGAVATIIGCAAEGWLYGMATDLYRYGYGNPFSVTPNRLGLAVVGALVGVVVAGSLFGVIAAVFEMHRHLRNLDLGTSPTSDTAGPTPAIRRTEPKLV